MSVILLKAMEKLKKMTLLLSAHVEERVVNTIIAFEQRDAGLASKVVEADHVINELEIEVEEECYRVLALQQPVAIDLRFINAVVKINKDLERIGDLAVENAKHTMELLSKPEIDMGIELSPLTESVRDILKASLNALMDLDDDLAFDVCESKDKASAENEVIQMFVKESLVKHPEWSGQLMRIAKFSDNIERIARLSSNITEEVIYIVKGKIVRHDKGTIQKRTEKKFKSWLESSVFGLH